mmetsp:Transcript_53239/g.116881  ORF Transcript_53239/g.116881 Transcript_53239/m.116881 type:complete len:537 (-) Transcript_53239:288-1898(-)|eukprot:CAMPEP_0204272308 /NCGR_PEP_ID=MMETSP0468-20130131/22011_1 /ASSEMBLY_ACC=CAM_ASM_000383 /TAXON_ID=2969 /ORGANISM="Oxyrrhis marina" /LENGTH=536 /DNA_ID=CAMNT_0051248135 /DNA_START=44 /DNA_END=1654 /DNA_ORIENTATION=+
MGKRGSQSKQKKPSEVVETYVVLGAGSREVNGVYSTVDIKDDGAGPSYRKDGTDLGLLRFRDGFWYLSDCGKEFKACGEDHVDYYVCAVDGSDAPRKGWEVEQGVAPAPEVQAADSKSISGMAAKALKQAQAYMGQKKFALAAKEAGSAQALDPKLLEAYAVEAEAHLQLDQRDDAFDTVARLGGAVWLREGYADEHYTKLDRQRFSEILQRARPIGDNVVQLTQTLLEHRVHRFLDYILGVTKQVHLLTDNEGEPVDDAAELRQQKERLKLFRQNGGLQCAEVLRSLYRSIDVFCFDSRDTALSRSRIFHVTDALRILAEGTVINDQERDPTFKSFWKKDQFNEENPYQSAAAALKDNDPKKEKKCPVINSINKGEDTEENVDDMDEKEYQDYMRRTLLKVPKGEKISGKYTKEGNVDLDFLIKHDCNATYKMISVHGVVFDVSDNLEKYAPDGEYFFFAGKDISWCLSCSALNGEYANTFFKWREEHLRKIYGWMEYYKEKYTVVGYLDKFDQEDEFADPPEEEDEPEMECSIM